MAADSSRPPLRLLFAEDSDDDAALVIRAVRQAGYELDVHRVDSAPAFREALRTGTFDVIISDHAMPQFGSAAALALLHEDGRDLPFIVVSGTIDEETAVSILRAGAHDFVTKQNLARLGPALKRELKEAQNRARHRGAVADLRKQHHFLRLVIDAAPDLIYVKDQAGRFVLANQATADLYGSTVERLLDGTGVPEEAQGNDRDAVRSDDASSLRRIEAIIDRRTGEIRWFDALTVPLVEADLSARRLVIATDITERKRTTDALKATEAQLMHSQKMEAIGQLAGGIAHDFNNLLTVIMGYSQMVLDRVQDSPKLAADVLEIVRSGERASLLTRQLLAFSRKQVMELKTLNLNTVVGELDRMLRRVIGEDVQFETSLAPAIGYVRADPSQLEQVIMNLAVNARDAMPHGGALTIETSEGPAPRGSGAAAGSPGARFVLLSVRDTGSGIPPDVQARMFEPFFTTKAQGKGTGLGLSTVYGIVTQIGGHVTVDSVMGRGTTFTIALPAIAAPVDASVAAGDRASQLRGTETVLLAEDEAAVRHLVERSLTRYGYRVLPAASAADAITTARTHAGPIDLVITDIVMPDVRGPVLARQLREVLPDVAVLYMSGFTEASAGAMEPVVPDSGFLHKPFSPDGLAAKVRECLNRRRGPAASNPPSA